MTCQGDSPRVSVTARSRGIPEPARVARRKEKRNITDVAAKSENKRENQMESPPNLLPELKHDLPRELPYGVELK